MKKETVCECGHSCSYHSLKQPGICWERACRCKEFKLQEDNAKTSPVALLDPQNARALGMFLISPPANITDTDNVLYRTIPLTTRVKGKDPGEIVVSYSPTDQMFTIDLPDEEVDDDSFLAKI